LGHVTTEGKLVDNTTINRLLTRFGIMAPLRKPEQARGERLVFIIALGVIELL